MQNLAIIPARSGSKGLKDKNIKSLDGKPLMAYSIMEAQKSGIFSNIMVSTDSELYAEIAKDWGAEVPFLRSAETSGDFSGSWDVVKEVLNQYRDLGMKFDTVCLLQPTSPLRTAEDIQMGYQALEQKNADAITTVCEMDHSPLWTMTLNQDLSLTEFRKHARNVPRQQLETYYRINGAIYIRRVEYLDGGPKLKTAKEYACVMEKTRSVDIDTIEDFEYAEFLLGRR